MPFAVAPELTDQQARKSTLGFFIVMSIAWLLWPLFDNASFGAAMYHSWWGRYAMGFGKFFALGMFGEMYKKKWKVDRIWTRAFVWGLFGVWITAAILGFGVLVNAMIAKHLWFSFFPALSKSLWINIIGGYAWTMMLAHDYVNFVIGSGGRVWSGKVWAAQADKHFLLYFIPCTFIFWVVAHTGTFSLPDQYQPLAAAVLAIALGVFQSWAKRKPTAVEAKAA